MIDKYFDGVIEQVFDKVQKAEGNIVMACYNNDFSVLELDSVKRYSQNASSVFFACCQYEHNQMVGAYEPFLEVICQIHKEYIKGDFSSFLEENNVYYLHRSTLESYYNTGICKREEPVLLDEVSYEQIRLREGVIALLKAVSEVKPILFVINRFQLASKTTIELIEELYNRSLNNIGIVLGASESLHRAEVVSECWNSVLEKAADSSQLYRFGATGVKKTDLSAASDQIEADWKETYNTINNMTELLDVEQAIYHMHNFEKNITSGTYSIEADKRANAILLYVRASILASDLSKALELIEILTRIPVKSRNHYIDFECAYYIAVCYMYQGKLKDAENIARMAEREAVLAEDEMLKFRAELLISIVQMSGWHNVFFCVNDVKVPESLLEKLTKYNYRNHLAHVYIYAYDNGPEVVAKAYRSEALLTHFSKGIALSKELNNEYLVYAAYQKNVMIAATNGMNEIALLYLIRSYQFVRTGKGILVAQIFMGIGYNLCALGHNEMAENYYHRAIETLYELGYAKEVAEAHYNLSLNYIMKGEIGKAESALLFTMKTVEKLHMNSLRVCNLSKLYALMALVSVMQGQKYSCERNLLNCRQFLNYILDKKNTEAEIIHDYARCEDDMFLYTYAAAMLDDLNGNDEDAFEKYEEAELYLSRAEGNQFYVYDYFRRSRVALFERMGKKELCEIEKNSLQQHQEIVKTIKENTSLQLLEEIKTDVNQGPCTISEKELYNLIKNAGIEMDYKNNRKHMFFLAHWQKLIDVTRVESKIVVEKAMRSFMNHFNNDRTVYIKYTDDDAMVLFNNCSKMLSKEQLREIETMMADYPDGFVTSKISENFLEHMDFISIFGIDEVCSFVAIPYYSDGKIQSVFITYVLMQDNWHNSISRYMLDNGDLGIYRLLFRELNNSINRIEANEKIYEMNSKLAENSVRDMLTGVYNRAGLYREAAKIDKIIREKKGSHGVGLMFLDLDNFKPYNDTYGHDIGDIVLQEMAKIFVETIGDRGIVCRYGGDEFIVITTTNNKDELKNIAEEIYDKIEKAEGFKKEIEDKLEKKISMGQDKKIGCSIGISTSDAVEKRSIDEMIKQADDLLYTVKTTNKGTYAFI